LTIKQYDNCQMALESENQMLDEKIEMKSKEKKSTIG
jgi:hypothetical protein